MVRIAGTAKRDTLCARADPWSVAAATGRPARRATASLAGHCVTAKREPFVPREKLAKGEAKTGWLHVRVRPAERRELQKLAKVLNQKPSGVVRRLMREAITGGPEYFDDGLQEIRTAHRELAAVGRNINQLAKAANRDERVVSKDLRRNLAAAKQQVDRLTALFRDAVERIHRRNVDRVEL